MAIREVAGDGTVLALDEVTREATPQYRPGFNFTCTKTDIHKWISHLIPWHFHDHLEINYVSEGELIFQLGGGCEERLRQGEAIFVNARTLHKVETVGDAPGKENTVQFDQDFLSGGKGNMIYLKYIQPVLECRDLPYYVLRPDSEDGLERLSSLLRIFRAETEEPPHRELLILGELTKVWCGIFMGTEKILAEEKESGRQSGTMRLQQMVDFIDTHFHEKLTLSDIAASASISERECSRVFRQELRISPVEYLNSYRLRWAGHLLLDPQDRTISDISESCGFSSVSYFGKAFSNEFGCSPREYRRRARAFVGMNESK